MTTHRVHELKAWPAAYEAVDKGLKRYEVRKDDRDFAVGDYLHLREYNPSTETYTGRSSMHVVTYKTEGGTFELPRGTCVLGISLFGYTDVSSPYPAAMMEPKSKPKPVHVLDRAAPNDVYFCTTDVVDDRDFLAYVKSHWDQASPLFHRNTIRRLYSLTGKTPPGALTATWYVLSADVGEPLVAEALRKLNP